MVIPTSLYVALGAVLAALVAGFFSFINLVSTKENKVSEFRLSWIDGLRNEIAEFTAAIHELVRINAHRVDVENKDWLEIAAGPYTRARENLTRIHLRLNPARVKDEPDGLDAKLMAAVQGARESFNRGENRETIDKVEAIRVAAAPLLKNEWERVKNGETTYRRVRTIAWVTIVIGVLLLAAGTIYLLASASAAGA